MDNPALVDDRQQWLLERLQTHRRIMTNDVAAELGLSVDTIRRDLRSLHERGLLRRVHGGAVPVSTLSSSFAGRSADPSAGRTLLAASVVERFRDGDLIGLDAGSTTEEIAARIPQSLQVTIVTNSPAAALALSEHRSATVVLLGGTVDLTWMATTGPETVDAWRGYRLDIAVLGACAFDPKSGVTTRSRNEVATKRALIEAAAETVLPMQSEKLGIDAPYHVVDAGHVDTLIVEPTDSASRSETALLKRCRKLGVDVAFA